MVPGSSFKEQCTEWHNDSNLQSSLSSSLFNDLKWFDCALAYSGFCFLDARGCGFLFVPFSRLDT
jgi:hypothetical protein